MIQKIIKTTTTINKKKQISKFLSEKPSEICRSRYFGEEHEWWWFANKCGKLYTILLVSSVLLAETIFVVIIKIFY